MASAVDPAASTRRRPPGTLLVLPGVAWLLAFFLLPLLIIFIVSFGSKDATGHVLLNDLGLRNYIEASKPEFLLVGPHQHSELERVGKSLVVRLPV